MSPNPSVEHESLVTQMLVQLHASGAKDIKVYGRDPYPSPDSIPGEDFENGKSKTYFPDITCNSKQGVFEIYEVEIEDSISQDHTYAQLRAFSQEAKLISKHFFLIVPKDCYEKAINLLNELNAKHEQVDVIPF